MAAFSGMRFLFFAMVAAGLWAQGTGAHMAGAVRKQLVLVDDPAVREAVAPVADWLGAEVVVFDDRKRAFPYDAVPEMLPAWPPVRRAGEVIILGGTVFVGVTQVNGTESGARLAEFLSHAKAHVEAGDAARVAEFTDRMRVQRSIPHFPEKYMADLREFVDGVEQDTQSLVGEIYAGTGCPDSCGMFARLREAVGKIGQ